MDLLEREWHLEALGGFLREAAAGQGRLVLIGGEAGVGKSTLVERFCRDVATRGRGRTLFGACDALSTPRPLGPLRDIAAETGGALDRLLTDDAPRHRVFRALLAELGRGLTPTVVVIEDAHWADEATLDLLRFLGRRLELARSLLVVTYRDDEVGPTHPLRLVLGDLATTKTVRRLSLAPLSVEGVRALVAGSQIDPVSLHRLTGGNPFFASEVLAAEAAVCGGIPETVRDAVMARASRLPPTARETLDAAAIIGSPLAVNLLTEVAGNPAEALDACLASGMLVVAGARAVAFRHELARMAIHDAIAPARRRDLHARVLSALRTAPAAEQDLARLAHHAEAADDGEAVLRFAPAAARRAGMVQAHREAAAQFARALRFAQLRPPRERAELLEAYSYECYLTGQLGEAVALRREALRLWRETGDRLREGDALRWVSRCLWFAGRNDDAIAAAEEALAILEPLPPGRELAMALSNRSQLHMLRGETSAAVAWGERAIARAEALNETDVRAHALNNVGSARLKDGKESGRDELERSLALARGAGLEEHVARALTNLGWNAVQAHDLPRAEAYFADGVAYTTDHDLDSWRHYMLSWRGYLRLLRGDWTAATDDAGEVLAVPHAAPVSRIAALVTRGLVRARRGDPGAAEPLDEALAFAEPTGEIQRLRPVRTARAEAAWLAGDHDRAAAEVRAVLDLTLRRGSPWDIGDVLVWRHRLGPTGAVGQRPDATSLPEPYRLALVADWAGAAAAWEALGCPYNAALTLLDGDEAGLRRALAICERLGARPVAAIAARRLRELGARSIPRGPRPGTRGNPANLTARELEILPFLADGWRNAEIAERLYLSPKTVGHHVGHILAKLGARSRRDVSAAAGRFGLLLAVDQDRAPDSPR